MSYGNVISAGSCVETKKHLKAAIKRQKKTIDTFIGFTNTIDMPWEARNQTVGQLYLDLKGMKKRLKEHYGKK